MKTPEILSPAGGIEQLIAAVRCGADAVYLGSRGFNARRGAENFDREGLAQAVRYCHGRGVKVHVTLNTLVTQTELPALEEELALIAASGADAVIVQDLGVAALVRRCCPTLALHASTQLSVHSLAGALFMKELGFGRLVLARELTGPEIREIKEKSGLEVEIFVHGALCMSLSGSCYLSALLGERSGNRGMCAQPCRLEWKSPQGRPYALSLKDLTLVPRMAELVALGVDSLKIEGRLKRPEYVAAATTACRQALAGQQPDMERLQAVFSRSGFTDGYLTGKRTVEMFGYRRREDVAAASGVFGELAALYRGELARAPVSMEFAMAADKPATLTITDGVYTARAAGDIPQTALNRPTDRELAERSLAKLGGTPFFLDKLEADIAPGLMLPVSAINGLRKAAAEDLLAQREATQPHAFAPAKLAAPTPRPAGGKPALRLRLERAEQLTKTVKSTGAMIILPLSALYSNQNLVAELGERLAAELPMLVFPGQEAETAARLATLRELGLTKALATTQGGVQLARDAGLTVLGDYTLNILNSVALGAYRLAGLADTTLSIEGTLKNAKAMGGDIPTGVVGYGYLPVMTFRNCPARGEKGCGGCSGVTHITDRRGTDFPLLCREKQYSQLLNPIPLYLGDRQETFSSLDFVTLLFTTENPAEVDRVLTLWQDKMSWPGPRTGGLYFRELQ